MPANTSAAHRLGMGTHPATRLVSVSGASDLATPRDVERQAAAGGFFWLDLESLDGELLAQFGRSLRLGTSAIAEPEDTGRPAGMAMGTARASSYRLVHSSLSSCVVTSKVCIGSLTLTTPSITCSLSCGSHPVDRNVLPTAFGVPDCHSTRYGLGDHSP